MVELAAIFDFEDSASFAVDGESDVEFAAAAEIYVASVALAAVAATNSAAFPRFS